MREEEIKRLLAEAKEMTPEEQERQRISFAFGNCNGRVSLEDVVRAARSATVLISSPE